MSYKKFTIYTDGGARNNPGPAGIGVVIANKNGDVVERIAEYIGEATNNQAEYRAVIEAIKRAKALGASELELFLDSELVVKQLNREYKVKDKDLAPLFLQVYNQSLKFRRIVFKYIPREMNKEADKLVNEAINQRIAHNS